MHRNYQFRLYPTPAQAETLGQWIGVTRYVYNLALEQRRDFWRQYLAAEGRNISFQSQGLELTALRAECDWIDAVPQAMLEGALDDLDKAYRAFFRGKGYPRPRKLGVNDSARYRGRKSKTRNISARWAEIRVPKLGWVRYRRTRDLLGTMVVVTVKRTDSGWFVVMTCDIGVKPDPNGLPAVGIDRGIANTFSLSTGEHVRLPDTGDIERRRRGAQRALARRKRGSRRYAAQRKKASRLAAKIARIRSHRLHEASNHIAARFGVVALERLNVKAMSASASGTIAEPGHRVAQKRGLNRAMRSQGWTLFAAMLEYKLEAAGGRLVYVPAPYTSQTCAECGVVDAGSRKNQAVFSCVACGHQDHADTNAARNIMRGSTAPVEGPQPKRPVEARTSAALSLEPA